MKTFDYWIVRAGMLLYLLGIIPVQVEPQGFDYIIGVLLFYVLIILTRKNDYAQRTKD